MTQMRWKTPSKAASFGESSAMLQVRSHQDPCNRGCDAVKLESGLSEQCVQAQSRIVKFRYVTVTE